ncbi:SDR family NAD(P)-dependent oxidoreductase [Emcibacter sp.]|uniref:SDR family NAD(P)-dependent oxidoreductase n=1 Tax=Emcibacter sp. TaxID=1979954 RepID=UPI003A9057CC
MDIPAKSLTVYPDLRGQHVFITGGATGIGAALVRSFSAQGARVAFIDFDEENALTICDEIEKAGAPRPWFKKVDVTEVPKLQAAIREAVDELGNIYALINNVANDSRHSPEEFSEEDWRKTLAVNLDPVFFAAQAAFPGMKEEQRGSIINFGSISALLGQPDMPGYITAKAAIMGLTRSLARAYGPSKVRVNTLMPGWVVTERQLDLWLTPEAEADWQKQVALTDRLLPQDVANLALFLASSDSRMITAQELVIDAGRI